MKKVIILWLIAAPACARNVTGAEPRDLHMFGDLLGGLGHIFFELFGRQFNRKFHFRFRQGFDGNVHKIQLKCQQMLAYSAVYFNAQFRTADS